MIRRILVPLDNSEYSKHALDVACTLAKYHKAEVTGVTILDIPGIRDSIGTIPLGAAFFAKELTDAKIKEAEKRIDSLIDNFKKVCDDYAVGHHVSQLQGIPSDQILEVSKYYDLLVIGKRTYFHFESEDKPGDSFSKIMDNSITPILAVPKQFDLSQLKHKPLKIMIAFDGSLPACRALQRFAHLAIDEIVDIHLVMSSKDKDYADYAMEQAKCLLEAHNLKNVSKFRVDENIIEVIEKKYLDWADIFVLGVHSSSAIERFFTGSVTNYVIDNSKRGIFIGQ